MTHPARLSEGSSPLIHMMLLAGGWDDAIPLTVRRT
jgi:hypothetical protein